MLQARLIQRMRFYVTNYSRRPAPWRWRLRWCAHWREVRAGRAENKLKIITATTDLASLAQEVGGDKVDVESIAKGYQDPHFVEAKPSFLLKLRKADLLIVVGLELEIGWLPPLITQSSNPNIQVSAHRLSGRFPVCEDSGDSYRAGDQSRRRCASAR